VKFCQDHWEKLRAAIEKRGLSALVADSGEKAAANMASSLEQGQNIDNFDPLMGAHNAIVSNVMNVVGLAIMQPNPDGTDRCPLCFINSEHKEHCKDPVCKVTDYEDWIDKAADEMVAVWKQVND
jgi:hypothetical protein